MVIVILGGLVSEYGVSPDIQVKVNGTVLGPHR
jgi:hypothetical protein